MTERPEDDRPPCDRVHDIDAILEALGRGVREALLRHARLGNPIAVWEDGRVVWIPPEEIEAGLEPESERPGSP